MNTKTTANFHNPDYSKSCLVLGLIRPNNVEPVINLSLKITAARSTRRKQPATLKTEIEGRFNKHENGLVNMSFGTGILTRIAGWTNGITVRDDCVIRLQNGHTPNNRHTSKTNARYTAKH
jgi:hypothetical protein